MGPLRYLRFNYTTGDAAGQNMTGRATWAACEWIQRVYPRDIKYILSGGLDTDKKHSHLNTILTRGKRVVAEAVLRKDLLKSLMGVDTKELFFSRQIHQTGAFLAGSANNGAHAANGLAALFIATGQDAANVSESHAGINYCQLLDNGDYYWSVTLPALIVATCGGGTGLATQRQCLEILDCYGNGKANKFAEICAATVLAGETSLACAVLHGDWVIESRAFGPQSALRFNILRFRRTVGRFFMINSTPRCVPHGFSLWHSRRSPRGKRSRSPRSPAGRIWSAAATA